MDISKLVKQFPDMLNNSNQEAANLAAQTAIANAQNTASSSSNTSPGTTVGSTGTSNNVTNTEGLANQNPDVQNLMNILNMTQSMHSLPFKIDRPVYSTPPPCESSLANNECHMTTLHGHKVAAFNISGDEYICLPQVFEHFLKHLVGGLHTVYTKLKRLNIIPLVCNVEQVRTLRAIGAIQPGVNRCKLITKRDFESLYHDCTTSSARPGRPPKRVTHVDETSNFQGSSIMEHVVNLSKSLPSTPTAHNASLNQLMQNISQNSHKQEYGSNFGQIHQNGGQTVNPISQSGQVSQNSGQNEVQDSKHHANSPLSEPTEKTTQKNVVPMAALPTPSKNSTQNRQFSPLHQMSNFTQILQQNPNLAQNMLNHSNMLSQLENYQESSNPIAHILAKRVRMVQDAQLHQNIVNDSKTENSPDGK